MCEGLHGGCVEDCAEGYVEGCTKGCTEGCKERYLDDAQRVVWRSA